MRDRLPRFLPVFTNKNLCTLLFGKSSRFIFEKIVLLLFLILKEPFWNTRRQKCLYLWHCIIKGKSSLPVDESNARKKIHSMSVSIIPFFAWKILVLHWKCRIRKNFLIFVFVSIASVLLTDEFFEISMSSIHVMSESFFFHRTSESFPLYYLIWYIWTQLQWIILSLPAGRWNLIRIQLQRMIMWFMDSKPSVNLIYNIKI